MWQVIRYRPLCWALLHEQQFFTWHKEILLVGYPLVPLIAVMPLGYCLGTWYAADYDAKKGRKIYCSSAVL